MNIVLLYLLIGTIYGYILDKLVTSVDAKDKFTTRESLWAITLWPILILLVMYSFLEGLFESLGDD